MDTPESIRVKQVALAFPDRPLSRFMMPRLVETLNGCSFNDVTAANIESFSKDAFNNLGWIVFGVATLTEEDFLKHAKEACEGNYNVTLLLETRREAYRIMRLLGHTNGAPVSIDINFGWDEKIMRNSVESLDNFLINLGIEDSYARSRRGEFRLT